MRGYIPTLGSVDFVFELGWSCCRIKNLSKSRRHISGHAGPCPCTEKLGTTFTFFYWVVSVEVEKNRRKRRKS